MTTCPCRNAQCAALVTTPLYAAPRALPHRVLREYGTIHRMLGQGAFGSVRIVRHARAAAPEPQQRQQQQQQQQQYVIKTEDRDQEQAEGLGIDVGALHEATVLARLDHPNVVRLVDVVYVPSVRTPQVPHLSLLLPRADTNVWSWVPHTDAGYTSPVWRASYGFDSQYQLRRFAYQLLSALEHAHARGVVHGDVKPDNILMQWNSNSNSNSNSIGAGAGAGAGGVDSPVTFVLADFGLSTPFQCSPLHGLKALDYAALYRAPEVFGASATHQHGWAADIWAAAMCIYFVATGHNWLQRHVPAYAQRQLQQRGDGGGDGDNAQHTYSVLLRAIFDERTRTDDGRGFMWPLWRAEAQDVAHTDWERLLARMVAYNPAQRASAAELLADPMFDSVRPSPSPAVPPLHAARTCREMLQTHERRLCASPLANNNNNNDGPRGAIFEGGGAADSIVDDADMAAVVAWLYLVAQVHVPAAYTAPCWMLAVDYLDHSMRRGRRPHMREALWAQALAALLLATRVGMYGQRYPSTTRFSSVAIPFRRASGGGPAGAAFEGGGPTGTEGPTGALYEGSSSVAYMTVDLLAAEIHTLAAGLQFDLHPTTCADYVRVFFDTDDSAPQGPPSGASAPQGPPLGASASVVMSLLVLMVATPSLRYGRLPGELYDAAVELARSMPHDALSTPPPKGAPVGPPRVVSASAFVAASEILKLQARDAAIQSPTAAVWSTVGGGGVHSFASIGAQLARVRAEYFKAIAISDSDDSDDRDDRDDDYGDSDSNFEDYSDYAASGDSE